VKFRRNTILAAAAVIAVTAGFAHTRDASATGSPARVAAATRLGNLSKAPRANASDYASLYAQFQADKPANMSRLEDYGNLLGKDAAAELVNANGVQVLATPTSTGEICQSVSTLGLNMGACTPALNETGLDAAPVSVQTSIGGGYLVAGVVTSDVASVDVVTSGGTFDTTASNGGFEWLGSSSKDVPSAIVLHGADGSTKSIPVSYA